MLMVYWIVCPSFGEASSTEITVTKLMLFTVISAVLAGNVLLVLWLLSIFETAVEMVLPAVPEFTVAVISKEAFAPLAIAAGCQIPVAEL